MEIPVHNDILWRACAIAQKRGAFLGDPRPWFPILVRGSWINDTNQATVFTNRIEQPFKATAEVQRCLRLLWKNDMDALLDAMKSGERAPFAASADALVKTIPSNAVDDFGSYNRFDHLDVFRRENAAKEADYWKKNPLGRSETVDYALGSHTLLRLHDAALLPGGSRLEWGRMTELGQALHTVADFFAHTNYVELLLWGLAYPGVDGGLSQSTINVFNSRLLEPLEEDGVVCPLPPSGKVAEMAHKRTMFWYGESPAATPLVSSIFDESDTICTLLSMYVHYLELFDGEDPKKIEPYLNAAMAVVNVVARPLSVAASLYDSFQHALDGIGDEVRRQVAALIRQRVKNSWGAAVAQIMVKYDREEARKLADAGKYKEVIRTIRCQMISELDRSQHPDQFALPHHSLLRKDAALPRADDELRFNLACILAADVSADLISWFFSEQPSLAGAKAILERRLRHPWEQLTRRSQADNMHLSEYLSDLRGQPWRHVAHPEAGVLP